MLIARYTCNASGVVPTFNNGYVYEVNETENEGVYTVEISSNNDFSSCSFSGKSQLLTVEYLKVTSQVTNMYAMFNNCSNLTSLDVSNFDTSKVTSMDFMFQNCSNLTNLDLSNWDTSKVTNMQSMFNNCNNLTSIDLSNFDTSKVTNMSHIFNGCNKLKYLDLSNWVFAGSVSFNGMISNTPSDMQIGMLYCSYDTVNYLNLAISSGNRIIWVKDTKASDYTATNYVAIKDYKEEVLTIQLSEPLRGLPNGVKDRIIKKDGKWYVERNCGEIKNINNILSYASANGRNLFNISRNEFKGSNSNSSTSSISNKLQFMGWYAGQLTSDYQYYITTDNNLWISLPTADQEEALEYLEDIVIVGELITPTYEEITDLQVITYLDTTHISNNSIIPCNMQVTNTSYNGIIRANSEYTVILDGDITSNVNIKLGGAEISTIDKVNRIITPTTLSNNDLVVYGKGNSVNSVMLFEGDLTSNPPTEYFEGIQSSFEDQLVTQDMVDSGQEEPENLGKYKVEYKVTGKNKFDGELEEGTYYSEGIPYPYKGEYRNANKYIEVEPNTTYNVSNVTHFICWFYDSNKKFIRNMSGITQFTTPPNAKYINFRITEVDKNNNIQIEEGSTATEYEPYKSYTETFYLNSPLLKGDTIEDINGEATHIHRYGKVVLDGSESWADVTSTWGRDNVICCRATTPQTSHNGNIYSDKFMCVSHIEAKEGITLMDNNKGIHLAINKTKLVTQDIDGFKQWLSENPTTVVYELANPYYETISEDSILCDSYVNGHLDVNTNVPVNEVDFKPTITNLNYLYPSTEYTVQFESDNIGKIEAVSLGNEVLYTNYSVVEGINRFNITTPSEISSTELMLDGIGFNLSNLVVTQATDESFDYFEGIKSVGQDDENGHNIEVISNNRNLFNIDSIFSKENKIKGVYNSYPLKGLKPNTFYTFTKSNTLNENEGFNMNIASKPNVVEATGICQWIYHNIGTNHNEINIKSDSQGCIYFNTNIGTGYSQIPEENIIETIKLFGDIQIEEGISENEYTPHKLNTLQIPLSEPLRALPNGVKDKIVKIGGKWYVERNCAEERVLHTYNWQVSTVASNYYYYMSYDFVFNGNTINILSDKLKSATMTEANTSSYYTDNSNYIALGTYLGASFMVIDLDSNVLIDNSVEGFRQYLQDNEIYIIRPLLTPTYEPLEVDLTLSTYTDITHISNNSIIPCNMQVKNSGYNTIIKPSTQYTVALDTNTSGEVGISLGGAKVTTTNNVATITTPSTLTDDSLILTGKGIKASKIRLLEGDKTNYIPSYFEGMKSSFEDKLQDDESYKIEIISNNENLFNESEFMLSLPKELVNNKQYYVLKGINVPTKKNIIIDNTMFNFKRNTQYTFTMKGMRLDYFHHFYIEYTDGSRSGRTYNNTEENDYFLTSEEGKTIKVVFSDTGTDNSKSYILVNSITMSEGVNSISIPHKSDKIQLFSIEPLRGIGDVKDRFVFKDGKLMIERNCGEVTFNGSEDEHWIYHSLEQSNKYSYKTDCISSTSKSETSVKCNNFASGNPVGAWTHSYNNVAILNTNNCHIYCDIKTLDEFKQWLQQNPTNVVYQLAEPTYEEVPFELQKLIMECYVDATVFFDTNIPVTSTINYPANIPVVSALKEQSEIQDQQDAMILENTVALAMMNLLN